METKQTMQPRAAEQRRERIECLLFKYPEISAEEAEEIKGFVRLADATALGLLCADSRTRVQLQRFRRDERAEPSRTRNVLIIVTIIVLLVGLLAVLWDAGPR
jgi:hypothetical protein